MDVQRQVIRGSHPLFVVDETLRLIDMHVLRMSILCQRRVQLDGNAPLRNTTFAEWPHHCGQYFRFRTMDDMREMFNLLEVRLYLHL